jgi:hypothetical protein
MGHQYRGHLMYPLANKKKGNEKLPNLKDFQLNVLMIPAKKLTKQTPLEV